MHQQHQYASPGDALLGVAPAFFSFGMFIIDEIEYVISPTSTESANASQPKHTSLPGGAGLYALLGARLISPPPTSYRLSWILDAGSDLPPSSPLVSQIHSWATSTHFRRDDTRLTTRAWNGYGSATDPDYRAFHYLTPKLRLDVPDLTPDQLACRSWHMVCSSTRCEDILRQIEQRRKKVDGGSARGVMVWEPIPDECSPAELARLQRALAAGDGGVQVVSPNAEELSRFFDEETRGEGQDAMVTRLMGWDARDPNHDIDCVCVIREGKRGSSIYLPPHPGSTVITPTSGPHFVHPLKVHLPAYHDPSMASQVVDPTGGGNTYLGAYALALGYVSDITVEVDDQKLTQSSQLPAPVRIVLDFVVSALKDAETGSLGQGSGMVVRHVVAGICACIAAAYAIEQTGMPGLDVASQRWNRQGVGDRIELYLGRVGREIKMQLNEV